MPPFVKWANSFFSQSFQGNSTYKSSAFSPLFSFRCHGVGSVSSSSQQLPRRPVPSPRDPSWDSPAPRCPSAWGGEAVPASAHSHQQVLHCGARAEEGLWSGGGGLGMVIHRSLQSTPPLSTQETSRGGAADDLSALHPQPFPRALQSSFADPHSRGALQCKGAAPSRRQLPPCELSWEREGRAMGVLWDWMDIVPPVWRRVDSVRGS